MVTPSHQWCLKGFNRDNAKAFIELQVEIEHDLISADKPYDMGTLFILFFFSLLLSQSLPQVLELTLLDIHRTLAN